MVTSFCTNDMSNIVQNTQYCITEIDEFLTDIIQRKKDIAKRASSPIAIIDWARGVHPPSTHVWDNEVADKSIHFCTHDSSSNIIGHTNDCIQKTRRFLHLTLRMNESHSGFFTTVEDITRDFSFMDSSTWNPGFVDFNLPQFYSYVETTEYCIQDINALSKELTDTISQINTLETKSICENIDTFGKYVSCLNTKADVIARITGLIQSAQNILCSNKAHLDSIVKELQFILQPLQTEYEILLEASSLISAHQRALQTTQTRKEATEELEPGFCEIDIIDTYQSISTEFEIHNSQRANGSLYPIEEGNLYKWNQAITKCRILNDKIFSLSEVCNLQSFSSFNSFNNIPVVEDAQQMMIQFENNFADPNIFEQTTQYACKKLKESKIGSSLCENPLNNLSWIYSIHYFLEQTLESKEPHI